MPLRRLYVWGGLIIFVLWAPLYQNRLLIDRAVEAACQAMALANEPTVRFQLYRAARVQEAGRLYQALTLAYAPSTMADSLPVAEAQMQQLDFRTLNRAAIAAGVIPPAEDAASENRRLWAAASRESIQLQEELGDQLDANFSSRVYAPPADWWRAWLSQVYGDVWWQVRHPMTW